jgi:hypothetical protein
MTSRARVSSSKVFSVLIVGTTLAISFVSNPACRQTATRASADGRQMVSRTPDGDPDLQAVWNFSTGTPLERPPELAGKETLTPAEAAKFEEERTARAAKAQATTRSVGSYNDFWNERGAPPDWTKRTSLITDPRNGRLPAMTPAAEWKEVARAAAAANPGGPEDFVMADRCIRGFNAGPPMINGPYNNNVQIFQSRDVVVIYNEMVHHARIVPLKGEPLPQSVIPRYSGVSLGRWQGETLVVETTNFKGDGQLWINRQVGDLLHRTATDENLHLIERFTRTAPDTLLYEFTVSDPTVWTQPWSASLTMNKSEERIYEYACHEGNYAIANMLAGARAAEAATSGKARRKTH